MTPSIDLLDKGITLSLVSRAANADSSRRCLRGLYCLLTATLIFTGMTRSDAHDLSKDIEMYKVYTHIKLMNAKEFRCVELLWNAESKWNPKSNNPKSTAFGIPQLLKMTETNPYLQIDLGLKYIAKRYGSTCKAWDRFKKVKNY